MDAETAKPPEGANFHRSYPGTPSQVHEVRADLAAVVHGCPFADDLILMASEISTNAVVHSRSGQPGGTFTVRAEVRPGDYAWLEVEDQGGPWINRDHDDGQRRGLDLDEHGRGLDLVAALAGDGNWTVEAGDAPGTRVVWVWLNWPGES
jgi:anti-sigma regulatory factor (Ser/Thr protein kinase)